MSKKMSLDPKRDSPTRAAAQRATECNQQLARAGDELHSILICTSSEPEHVTCHVLARVGNVKGPLLRALPSLSEPVLCRLARAGPSGAHLPSPPSNSGVWSTLGHTPTTTPRETTAAPLPQPGTSTPANVPSGDARAPDSRSPRGNAPVANIEAGAKQVQTQSDASRDPVTGMRTTKVVSTNGPSAKIGRQTEIARAVWSCPRPGDRDVSVRTATAYVAKSMVAHLTTVVASVAQQSEPLKKIEEQMQALRSVVEDIHAVVTSIQEKTADLVEDVAQPPRKDSKTQ